tara:strand:- start:643 stop:834 length:192 start_codon:yes stop_codon:yes gene_type:complete
MMKNFMYVLENYSNLDLTKESDRRIISEALLNYMKDRHIVTYTDLNSARQDKKMKDIMSKKYV